MTDLGYKMYNLEIDNRIEISYLLENDEVIVMIMQNILFVDFTVIRYD